MSDSNRSDHRDMHRREDRQSETDRPNEYEPNDSRNVTGMAHTKDGRWSGDAQGPHGGEYEPEDSRNVTGVAQTRGDRWARKNDKEGDDNSAGSPEGTG
ncbi:hypothetical protein [Allosphingosinicella indica]|uniref:Uncharacterized protein n=1 Tax=Allosphingosinicella indica TaxID=941907 RepID=A0A1X7FYK5_9SPHN|nr:hypothetical protein [Allosphingosinicella indica]SMF61119.1 hypothetical protein SAMN06295910_0131 [Allosphingosinicella indica]